MYDFDDEITVVGSTNWSYSGLRMNHEASVLIRSKEVASTFKEAFSQLEVKK
ncbi:MAG TPA: phospholipase D-like domain-containing protein [Candidatus Hypogeohydataceae bacterium YC40]